jgi:acyl-CoA thioesterase I
MTATKLIVALGASNTAGFGVGAERAYPAVLERLLRARGLAVRVVNAGISGNTTGEMRARLDASIPTGTSLVVFQPGSNDARRGISDAERARNIAAVEADLATRGIAVVRVAAAFEAARHGNLQADDIHFTVTGHERIAHTLLDHVASALGVSG